MASSCHSGDSMSPVDQAKQLILNPNYRLDEIALHVGLGSVERLSRVFERSVGLTPVEYRRRLGSTPLEARLPPPQKRSVTTSPLQSTLHHKHSHGTKDKEQRHHEGVLA